ncbi:MAG: hypothetical protein AAFZ15_06955 [Bacteroidota bacterium]
MKELNDQDYEQIENYMQGNLPTDAAMQIEKKIQTDPAYKQALQLMQDLSDLEQQKGEMEMLRHFGELHKKNKNKVIILKHRRKRWAIAVAALLLVLVSWFVFENFFSTSKPTPNAESHDTDPSAQPSGLSQVNWRKEITHEGNLQLLGEEEDKALEQALIHHDNEEFAASLPFFETYFSGLAPVDEDYEMRLVVCKIYLDIMNDLANAERHALVVKNSKAIPSFKAEADFYLGIVAYEKEDVEEAFKLWESVAAQDHEPWKSKAKSLLQ